jgi:hypothetical protein
MQSTTSALPASEILTRDKRVRIWMKPKRREALLDEFERSGLSGAQFARLTGVNYSSFQNWVVRRRQKRGRVVEAPGEKRPVVAEPSAVRLFEAVVESEARGARPVPALPGPSFGGLLVELPGGSRMHIETPLQLQMAAELYHLLKLNRHRTFRRNV